MFIIFHAGIRIRPYLYIPHGVEYFRGTVFFFVCVCDLVRFRFAAM